MFADIQEATKILQTRGPTEATAAIQRALRGTSPASPSPRSEASVHSQPPFRAVVPAGVGIPPAPVGPGVWTGKARPGHRPKAEVPPGEFLAGSFSTRAGARDYKLYVPSGHRGQALPLVVMLHGCTQTPDDFASGTRMNAAAELKPCLVLYPAQAQRANSGRCWNWFKSNHQKRDRGEPSIIGGMTREIITRYGVDPRRVYVAGLSAGGAMAAILKSTHPDLFAAAGVHSGLPYGAAHDLPIGAGRDEGATSVVGRAGPRLDTTHRVSWRRRHDGAPSKWRGDPRPGSARKRCLGERLAYRSETRAGPGWPSVHSNPLPRPRRARHRGALARPRRRPCLVGR